MRPVSGTLKNAPYGLVAGDTVETIEPKPPPVTLFSGRSKFGWLNRLNRFAPIANFILSVTGMLFVTFMSVSKNCGPCSVLRDTFPKPVWFAAGTKSAVVAQGVFGLLQLKLAGSTTNSASGVPLRNPTTLPRLLRTPVLTGDHG